MRQLVYVSAASRELNDRDLEQILDASRRNNPKHDVTGMLLVIDLGFLQILEGPRQSVENVLARIAQDERHKSIKVLVDEDVDERLFGLWSMGFDQPFPAAPTSADVFAVTRDATANTLPPGKAVLLAALIRNFYDINTPQARLR
ncbi:MAG: hypothetical protein RJB62_453 [Pseudomonadota bacterium]|jgi:hypothetical protein